MTDGNATAETLGAIGTLGPTALILIPLAFALAVIIVVAIAWIVVGHGIRAELHGLRLDLRLFAGNEPLPELEPLEPPRILGPLRRLAPAAPLAPALHDGGPLSQRGRARMPSRPQ